MGQALEIEQSIGSALADDGSKLLHNNRIAIAHKLQALGYQHKERILLVQPVQVEEAKVDICIARRRRYYLYPPYALGVLTANLQNSGYQSKIVDLNYEVFCYLHSLEKDEQLEPKQIGLLWQKQLEKEIEQFQPHIVGISCTFTMGHPVLLKTADHLKALDPNIVVIAGGVHVTNAADIVLKEGNNIDFVALYESDVSFRDMLDVANNKKTAQALKQIGTRIDNETLLINDRSAPTEEELNVIPSYGDLPIGEYSNLGEIGTFRYWRPKQARGGAALSVRGCRAQCTFCSVRNFNGKGVRARSVQSVADEIQSLKENYGITHITWLDDDLFFDEVRAVALFNEFIKRDLKITWDASNGVIASSAVAHSELVHASAESGCIGMYVGIESGNRDILRSVRKPSGIKHFHKFGALMQQYPQIFTRGFLIIGFPQETIGQIRDTIQLTREMKLDWYTVSLLTPLPSTEMYDTMVDMGLIEDGSLCTEGEGFTMFSVRESERQRAMERKQKSKAQGIGNLLAGDPNDIPTKKQLNDLWLIADYQVNYERILQEQNAEKLIKLEAFLTDVSDRMTDNNPLSNLFLALIKVRLGKAQEAAKRLAISSDFLQGSEYWKKRFHLLEINPVYDHIRTML